MKNWFLVYTGCLLAILAVAGVGPGGRAQPDKDKSTGPYQITAKRPDDSIQVALEKPNPDKVTFVIKSPFGISNATIERQEKQWPKVVVLELHLKGLENFKVSTGKLSLHAAAGVKGGKLDVRQWKDNQELPGLDKTSPF